MSEQNDFTRKFKIARAAWRALQRAESEVERLQRYRNPNKRMRDDLFEHSAAVTVNRAALKHFFEKEFPGEETQG